MELYERYVFDTYGPSNTLNGHGCNTAKDLGGHIIVLCVSKSNLFITATLKVARLAKVVETSE